MTAHISTLELKAIGSDFWARIEDSLKQPHQGRSLLHDVAREGDVLSAEVLIDEGLNVNASDEYGHKPLHTAAFFGHDEMVQVLLERGAAVNAPIMPFGHTALTHAVMQGYHATARVLLGHGADVTVSDRLNHEGLLHIAAKNGDIKIAGILIASGVDVSAENIKGETARDVAARHHHSQLETILLKVMQHKHLYTHFA